jgi:copper chaperone CopZ
VEGQVAEVDGVSEVDVDLASGGMTVRGSGISDDAVAAAVAEAGYEAVVA